MTGPGSSRSDLNDLIADGQIGSLFNVVGAKETNKFQHVAMDKSRLHIPVLFGYDVIHGQHTVFPVPLALASSFDPDLVRQVSHVAAAESGRRRHPLGLLAHGRYRPRRALGPHHRGRGARTPISAPSWPAPILKVIRATISPLTILSRRA